MSVIWNKLTARLNLKRLLTARSGVANRFFMSYNSYKKRGGGPNRGGGRGSGRGRGRGGRGGGPPEGLSGKAIGMYYRQKSLAKKDEREKNEVGTVLGLYVWRVRQQCNLHLSQRPCSLHAVEPAVCDKMNHVHSLHSLFTACSSEY